MAHHNRERRIMPIAILGPVLLHDRILFIQHAGDVLEAS